MKTGFKNYIDRFYSVISHPFLPGAFLIFSFIIFTLHPGTLLDLMRLSLVVYLSFVFTGGDKLIRVTVAELILVLLVVVLVISSWFMYPDKIHQKSIDYLIAFPGMVLLTHTFAVRLNKNHTWRLALIGSLTVGAGVLIHSFRIYFVHTGSFSGLYSNIHHLGFFSVLVLPILFLCARAFSGWQRIATCLIVLADLNLLIVSGSKVSWLALLLSLLVTFLSFSRKIYILILMALIVSVILGISLFPSTFKDNHQIHNLTVNIQTDRRWVIWADAINMLKKNTSKEWIWGHGVGSFRYYFPEFDGKSSQRVRNKVGFPHNLFLQLLFENGIFGSILVTGGFASLLIFLRLAYARIESIRERECIVALFLCLLVVLVQCLFTKSLYSKYILYTLSLITGASFRFFGTGYIDKTIYSLIRK